MWVTCSKPTTDGIAVAPKANPKVNLDNVFTLHKETERSPYLYHYYIVFTSVGGAKIKWEYGYQSNTVNGGPEVGGAYDPNHEVIKQRDADYKYILTQLTDHLLHYVREDGVTVKKKETPDDN